MAAVKLNVIWVRGLVCPVRHLDDDKRLIARVALIEEIEAAPQDCLQRSILRDDGDGYVRQRDHGDDPVKLRGMNAGLHANRPPPKRRVSHDPLKLPGRVGDNRLTAESDGNRIGDVITRPLAGKLQNSSERRSPQ